MDKQNIVWITGASSGIGRDLALKFIANKYEVVGSGRRENPSVSEQIKYFQNNVSDFRDVKNVVDKISEQYNIDCLINNAGITSFKPFVENSIEDIESIIDTNLKGAIYTIKSVLPQMIEKKSGTIINILSVAAQKIFTNSSIYAASKSGLEIFSKVLREEVREHNIKIINIFPGATATDIWPQNALSKFSDKMMTTEKLAKFIFDVYKNSNDLSPEEIVVRPITGDL